MNWPGMKKRKYINTYQLPLKILNKQIYIFSGLGADERVFQQLDLSGFSVTHVQWVPIRKKESMAHYASRLMDQITTPKPILIGFSFGGMIATEIAKQIETEKIILLASAKTKKEIPICYRFAGKLNLHHIIPTKLMKNANFLTYWLFGVKSHEDKQLLKQILIDTDPVFLKWAIDKIVHWQNVTIPENCIHIHGTGDKILPFRYANSDIPIENGGHLITLDKAEQLTKIITEILS